MALTCADAFTFAPTTRLSSSVAFTQQESIASARQYSRLYAEESEEAEAPAEDAAAPAAAADDILNSPAFLKRKIDVLKSDIAAVEEKIGAANTVYEENKTEWGPQIENLRKEYSNISDRLAKAAEAGQAVATKEIATKLLAVLDNYDRAFQSVTPDTDEEKEIEAAYKAVHAKIISTFGELGINEVKTVGIEFDYEYHSAVMTRPDEDHEEGIVCEELAKGWCTEDGELIRVAMVVVAA